MTGREIREWKEWEKKKEETESKYKLVFFMTLIGTI